MSLNNGTSAQDAIQAIQGSGGYVTVIAGRLGVSRKTVYNLINRYATVRQALEDEREKQKDFAEGKLQESIRAGNMTAIIFYLKTQAKERGYVERQERTGADGGPIEVENTIVKVVFDDSYGDEDGGDTGDQRNTGPATSPAQRPARNSA